MTACPQCGTPYKPGDKFCNTCGTPIAQRAGGAGPSQAGGQAFAQGGYGGGPPGGGFPGGGPRCQMGHEIAPGASYCSQGHPIALDAMQFANDAYGPGFGGAPQPGQQYPAPQQNYGPPPGQPGYGGGQQGYADPGYGGGYGGGAPQQGYGGGAPGGGYAPGGPPPIPQGGGYAPQPGGYGGGAAPQAGFDAPVPAKILRGFLVAYQTNASGDYWALNGGRLTVGRAGAGENIDIPLADPTISSRHAVLVVDGPAATVTVEDTGSTNGTFVNDEHLGFNGRRDLRDGDRLRFGGFTCVVKLIGRV